jgi:hypothetical protein
MSTFLEYHLWKTVVEKSVEIVEKFWFSTGISGKYPPQTCA